MPFSIWPWRCTAGRSLATRSAGSSCTQMGACCSRTAGCRRSSGTKASFLMRYARVCESICLGRMAEVPAGGLWRVHSHNCTLFCNCWMQAVFLGQSMAHGQRCPMPRPLIYSASDAVYRRTCAQQRRLRMCVRGGGVLGCVQRMGHFRFKQQLCAASSCLDAGKRWVAESDDHADAAAAGVSLQRERCCMDARCAQQRRHICFGGSWGACSVWGMKQHSFALHDRAWMLGNAGSQRAMIMLMPGPLIYSAAPQISVPE